MWGFQHQGGGAAVYGEAHQAHGLCGLWLLWAFRLWRAFLFGKGMLLGKPLPLGKGLVFGKALLLGKGLMLGKALLLGKGFLFRKGLGLACWEDCGWLLGAFGGPAGWHGRQ